VRVGRQEPRTRARCGQEAAVSSLTKRQSLPRSKNKKTKCMKSLCQFPRFRREFIDVSSLEATVVVLEDMAVPTFVA